MPILCNSNHAAEIRRAAHEVREGRKGNNSVAADVSRRKLLRLAQYGYGARPLCRFNLRCERTQKTTSPLAVYELKRHECRAPLRCKSRNQNSRASIIPAEIEWRELTFAATRLTGKFICVRRPWPGLGNAMEIA